MGVVSASIVDPVLSLLKTLDLAVQYEGRYLYVYIEKREKKVFDYIDRDYRVDCVLIVCTYKIV